MSVLSAINAGHCGSFYRLKDSPSGSVSNGGNEMPDWLSQIWDKWPGDESIEELLEALKGDRMRQVIGDATDAAIRGAITDALIKYSTAVYRHSEENGDKPDRDTHAEKLADEIYNLLGAELNTLKPQFQIDAANERGDTMRRPLSEYEADNLEAIVKDLILKGKRKRVPFTEQSLENAVAHGVGLINHLFGFCYQEEEVFEATMADS